MGPWLPVGKVTSRTWKSRSAFPPAAVGNFVRDDSRLAHFPCPRGFRLSTRFTRLFQIREPSFRSLRGIQGNETYWGQNHGIMWAELAKHEMVDDGMRLGKL